MCFISVTFVPGIEMGGGGGGGEDEGEREERTKM